MKHAVASVEVRTEQDVVWARQHARELAAKLGFEDRDQTRIGTAVSELARNAFRYAGGGKVDFVFEEPALLMIEVSDTGPGIQGFGSGGEEALLLADGRGLVGAKRLMDTFHIATGAWGTTVTVGKSLPRNAVRGAAKRLSSLTFEPTPDSTSGLLAELEQQNKELLRALEEVREQKTRLTQLNQELEETNRGVVALYAELDEKAASLERASTAKTRFLSNMTHEFRTPLYSIKNLTWLLLNNADGPLGSEQRLQIEYIRRSAEDLAALVNDLLDIAKIEAGKIALRPAEFLLGDTFRGLRGVLKPLLAMSSGVDLVFEDPLDMPPVFSDEGKVAQILRNLVANALKFTEHGEVRVAAERDGRWLHVRVRDSGIGISAENQERIFDEFVQIESPLQQKSKGTGLGLPFSQKLATLLGGRISVESELGRGSQFTLSIPLRLDLMPDAGQAGPVFTVAVIDDDDSSRYLFRSMLGRLPVRVVEASSGAEGLRLIRAECPAYVFLDLLMPDMSGIDVLRSLREEDSLRAIRVALRTTKELDRQEQGVLEGLGAAWLRKSENFESEARNIRKLLAEAGLVSPAERTSV